MEISIPGRSASAFTYDQLIRNPASVALVVANPPAYPGISLRLRAIAIKDLIPPQYLAPDFSIVFHCRDGFAANIATIRLAGGRSDEPQALLAIEDPDAPWPQLKNRSGGTAGPFYLVWREAGKGRIAPEEWPYQIVRIAVMSRPELEFQSIRPSPGQSPDSAPARGFQVFVRHCFPCHTLNGEGDGHVGPDLNMPMGPTEYFNDGIFEKYIRNPGSIRMWTGQRMPSFSEQVLTNQELGDLRAYLAHMADERMKGAARVK